jgi:predicted AlkP superfamily phosphohydrolase/phosphomutase
MVSRIFSAFALSVFLLAGGASAQDAKPPGKPRVIVVGVNGMELDIIRPLLLRGQMPNLASVIDRGAYGKLRTVQAPNCPRVYSTLFTSTNPEEHGVTGFSSAESPPIPTC